MLSIIAKWWIAPWCERQAVAALGELAESVRREEPFTLMYPFHTFVADDPFIDEAAAEAAGAPPTVAARLPLAQRDRFHGHRSQSAKPLLSLPVRQVVTMLGGEYFLVPGLSFVRGRDVSGIGALRAIISGAVLEPDTPAYCGALDIDNGRVDIRPALRFAREQGLPLTVKGGGHSAAGYCLNHGGIVLDMSLLANIKLNPQTQILRVELVVRWAHVYDHLQDSGTGLIPVGGGCLTVGPGGFLLGGGYSFTSRSYGMGCDNLRSIDLVTDPVDARRNVEWAYHFGEALAPHSRGAYANYIDPLLTDWPEKYYGPNYARLCQIKQAVDPDGIFAFQQGIGSPFRPQTAEPLDLSPLNRTQFP